MKTHTGTSFLGKFDHRWFERYRDLISFDLFAWLTHAGPFTSEEQYEWDRASKRHDEESDTGMALLLAISRDREIATALEEQREPRLHYPAIPLETVTQRIEDLTHFYNEILREEDNHLVRRLYIEAINEQIDTLRMVQATHNSDNEAFARYNQRIFPIPSPQEMDLALMYLLEELQRGLQHQRTAVISTTLLNYLQQLRVLPPSFNLSGQHLEETANALIAERGEHAQTDKILLPAIALKRFLQQVLRDYQLDDWRVGIDPASVATRVDPQIKAILLTKHPVSLTKALQLLSHEIECHVLRAACGERSALALLGVGTAQYFLVEEGLAMYYDNATTRIHNPDAPETVHWEGTLATGFACGVQTSSGVCIPAHSFRSLYLFLEPYYQLHYLLTKRESTLDAAKKNAHRRATERCLRTFRGVPSLTHPGICSVKDNCYLRGHLILQQTQERYGEETLERLMIGAVASEYLDDVAALGIIAPAIRSRHIAHDPHILETIRAFS